MRTNNPFFTVIFTLLVSLLMSCDGENINDSDEGKGLVQISAWGYENDTLSFKLSIQYGSPGEETELEYAIYDGSILIQEGSGVTSVEDTGLNILFETPIIQLTLPKSTYAGKTLLLWADPEDKKTSNLYTTEQYVNLYRKQEIVIPN